MRIKIVTGYWMDCQGTPFRGVGEGRKDRYLGSIKAHCENLNYPIICYTHQRSYDELKHLKDTYNLNNLQIKIMELYDMKLHKEINKVRENTSIVEDDGRGTEILWGKLDVLEKELNDCDFIYWIDAGLQHPGIFPWRYSKKYNKIEDHKESIPYWWTEYDVYNFKELLNKKTIDILNNLCKNKVCFLTSNNPQVSYHIYENIGALLPPYPIGGFFGGDSKKLKKFIELYWDFCYTLLSNDKLATEEVVMKYCYDKLTENEKINFIFEYHAVGEHDEYHFEEWNENKNPKPLYMVWKDILNYENKISNGDLY